MVRNQRPGIADCFGFIEDDSQPVYKIVSVGIILKDCISVNAPGNNVVKSARSIYPCFSWHIFPVSLTLSISNL